MKCSVQWKGLRLLAVFVTMGLTTGCLEMTHELRIEEDGSGFYTLKYSISESAIDQFKAMERLAADLARASDVPAPPAMDPILEAMLDPREEQIQQDLKPYGRNGVTVKSLKISNRNAWRQVDLELAFASLKQLEETPFFQHYGFELSRDKKGNWVFWRRPHLAPDVEQLQPMSDYAVRELTPLLNGFQTTVRVTVPGRIISSTAHRSSLHTASWVFDFNKNPNVLITLQQQPFRIEFDARKASLSEIRYSGSVNPGPEM